MKDDFSNAECGALLETYLVSYVEGIEKENALLREVVEAAKLIVEYKPDRTIKLPTEFLSLVFRLSCKIDKVNKWD